MAGEEGSVRASIAQGDSKPLSGSNDDIGTPLSGGGQEGEGQEVGSNTDLDVGCMGLLDKALVVVDSAVGGRILDEDTADVLSIDELCLVNHLCMVERGEGELVKVE